MAIDWKKIFTPGNIRMGLGILDAITGYGEQKSAAAQQQRFFKQGLAAGEAGYQAGLPFMQQQMDISDDAKASLAKSQAKARNMLGASSAASEAATRAAMAGALATTKQALASSGLGATTFGAQAMAQAARQVTGDASTRAAEFGGVQAQQEQGFASQNFAADATRMQTRSNMANYIYGHGFNKMNLLTQVQTPPGAGGNLLPTIFGAAGQAGGFDELWG